MWGEAVLAQSLPQTSSNSPLPVENCTVGVAPRSPKLATVRVQEAVPVDPRGVRAETALLPLKVTVQLSIAWALLAGVVTDSSKYTTIAVKLMAVAEATWG